MNETLTHADIALLSQLLEARGRSLSVVELASTLGGGTSSITRQLDKLERLGCELMRDPHAVGLIRTGLGVWPDYLDFALSQARPREVEVYRTTMSTQDIAKSRADQLLVALADEQTGGRGRLGRRWHAPAGSGVLFSMTHQTETSHPVSIDRVSFLTAVAVARGIESAAGDKSVQIKWPNDLLVHGRKIAGILVEAIGKKDGRTSALVIGVGINVDLVPEHREQMPEALRDRVTSFRLEGWPADRLLVAERVITEIDRHLLATDIRPVIEEWRARNLYRDQPIRLATGGHTVEGTVLDLDPDEGLIVRRNTGEIVQLPAATTTVLP